MAFWGIEVRSGKPGTLSCSSDKGRYHLTQATLGLPPSSASAHETKGSFVQCNVGNRPGILICSLFPGKTDMCSLNLEFDEDEEVVFSVLGPNSVHLCGFFEERDPDQYGEDITEETSEDEEEEEEEEEEDLSDDGFIVADDECEEDTMVLSPGEVPNSGVKIVEVEDEVEAEKEGTQKAKKKDRKKKEKEEEEQKDLSLERPENNGASENNGTEKEEGNGEDNTINGEESVFINGKRKTKSKDNVEGEAEPPTKKQATEKAVNGLTEEAEVKTSKKKKKKSKKRSKVKVDVTEE